MQHLRLRALASVGGCRSDGMDRAADLGRLGAFNFLNARERKPHNYLPQRSRGSDQHKSRECDALFKNGIPAF